MDLFKEKQYHDIGPGGSLKELSPN